MRFLSVLAITTGLACCGVDGAPVRPDPVEAEASRSSGISVGISGTASMGIKGGSRR